MEARIQHMGTKTIELRGLIEDLTQKFPAERTHVASIKDAEML